MKTNEANSEKKGGEARFLPSEKERRTIFAFGDREPEVSGGGAFG